MFKIGDFSKLTNLSGRALHHYEELGLLIPNRIDESSNYRYYSAKQLEVVNQIKMLQQIGLPLKTIKDIIEHDDLDSLKHYYDLRQEEISEEFSNLHAKQVMIDTYLKTMNEEKKMQKYHVELKEIPKRKVMSIRRKIKKYDDDGQLWNQLYEESIAQNVTLTTPPTGMSLYHDKNYKETNIDLEVQSTVTRLYDNTDNVTYYEDDAFVLASITFNGSFDQMPQVTQAIAYWIEANNYKITGPMVNISHVSPAMDENPENWITESGFMLTKKQ